jgi:gluconokinase
MNSEIDASRGSLFAISLNPGNQDRPEVQVNVRRGLCYVCAKRFVISEPIREPKIVIIRQAIVIMGVSGSGKSTLGRALAGVLGRPFLEGDDFHPAANIAKMTAGIALTDEDRWPWLVAIGDRLRMLSSKGGAVVSCSALKRSYRDLIRSRVQTGVGFIQLNLDRETLQTRIGRREHFMPVTLLASQLVDLEPPSADEDALVVDGTLPTAEQIDVVFRWLAGS